MRKNRKIYIIIIFYPNMKVLQTKEIIPAKLDLKDKKILYLLSKNARNSYGRIAKEVGLSSDAVAYRIKSYEKGSLITGYGVSVDISKFNYNVYHLFVRLNNPKPVVENIFSEKLKMLSFTRAVIKLNGSFDFEIAFIAKNILDLESKLSEIFEISQNQIKSYELLIITKNYLEKTFPISFFPDGFYVKENKKINFSKNLVKKDFQILKIISKDSSCSLVDIASKIKLSADIVRYRLDNLTKSLNLSFFPIINYDSIGYNIHIILLNIKNFNPANEKKLNLFLQTDKNILWVVKTIGKYNLLLYTCTKEEKEVQKTLKQLRSMFPEEISDYEYLFAEEEIKYTYLPECIFKEMKLPTTASCGVSKFMKS